MTRFKAACVQLRSTDDVLENVRLTSALVREAAGQGAQFIATPENTTLMAPDGGAKLERSYDEEHDPQTDLAARIADKIVLLTQKEILPGFDRPIGAKTDRDEAGQGQQGRGRQ